MSDTQTLHGTIINSARGRGNRMKNKIDEIINFPMLPDGEKHKKLDKLVAEFVNEIINKA